MNYKTASEKLGERASKKLGNNTYLQRRGYATSEDKIAVRLHETDVLTFTPSGRTILDSGGWRTVTTKDRMNSYLPMGFAVWSDKGDWSLYRNGSRVAAYRDGLTIGPRGGIHGAASVRETKGRATLKKRITAYAKACAASLPLDYPDAGDCLYCQLRTGDDQSLGDAMKDTDHLLSHMAEGYIVPSLVWAALTEAGYDPQAQMIHAMAFGQMEEWSGIGRAAVKRSVAKYMKRRFNLA